MDIVKIGNQYYDENGEEYDFTDIREEEIWILKQENKKLEEQLTDKKGHIFSHPEDVEWSNSLTIGS